MKLLNYACLIISFLSPVLLRAHQDAQIPLIVEPLTTCDKAADCIVRLLESAQHTPEKIEVIANMIRAYVAHYGRSPVVASYHEHQAERERERHTMTLIELSSCQKLLDLCRQEGADAQNNHSEKEHDLMQEIAHINQQLQSLVAENKTLQDLFADAQSFAEAKEQEVARWQEEYHAILGKKNELAQQIESLNHKLHENWVTYEAALRHARAEMELAYKQAKEQKADRRLGQQKIDALNAQLFQVKQELECVQGAKQLTDTLRAQIASLNSEVATLRTALAQKSAELDQLKATLGITEKEKQSLQLTMQRDKMAHKKTVQAYASLKNQVLSERQAYEKTLANERRQIQKLRQQVQELQKGNR